MQLPYIAAKYLINYSPDQLSLNKGQVIRRLLRFEVEQFDGAEQRHIAGHTALVTFVTVGEPGIEWGE